MESPKRRQGEGASPGWWRWFPSGTSCCGPQDPIIGCLLIIYGDTSHHIDINSMTQFCSSISCNNYSLAKNGPSSTIDFWPSAWVLVASSGCQLWYMGGLASARQGCQTTCHVLEAYFCASGNTALIQTLPCACGTIPTLCPETASIS